MQHRQHCTPKNFGPQCTSFITKRFYQQNNNQLVWSSHGYVNSNADAMIELITHATQDGLNPDDYNIVNIQAFRNQLGTLSSFYSDTRSKQLAHFDWLLTDAVLHYSSDLSRGKIRPDIAYPQWKLAPKNVDLIAILNYYIANNDLQSFLHALMPTYVGYYKLRKQLSRYQKLANNGGWPVIPGHAPLKLGMHNDRVWQLQQHLLMSGELDNVEDDEVGVFNPRLQAAVIQFQKNNGVNHADGVVGPTTLRLLNISITTRILQIASNMDRLRYLPQNLGDPYILVNIPDFSLHVISDNNDILNMPVIVGQVKHQSCILNGTITYLELNPYWNIPKSIAIKEILPHLQQDPNYLTKNNMVAFTKINGEKTVIDPISINWQQIESNNFIYEFRQNPGDENALGAVKFVFQNNCGIYLHDTDMPSLFANSKRAFSHGCIRIAKPLDLASYLLQGNDTSWDNEKIESAIDAGVRHVMTLKKPINIHVIYATAWVDANGILQFRPDIYGIDQRP